MKKEFTRFLLSAVFYFLLPAWLCAQLDSIHWIPPLHFRDNTQIADHYIYLSTPEASPFTVTIKDGAGNVLASPPIDRLNPYVYTIGNGQTSGSPAFVKIDSLNKVLTKSGLILSGSHRFYANLRAQSASQAECPTAKGRAAAGTTFRLGGFPLPSTDGTWDFTAGIIATQDSTTVKISQYDTACIFAGVVTSNADSVTITLNQGECYVIAGYPNTVANRDGFLGALVQSNKPIVVSNGNLLGNITTGGNGGQDMGMDQTVPVNRIGQQYILIEGGGSSLTERPLVITHYDSTAIFINGNPVAVTTINAGQYYLVPNSYYQGVNNKNMHIYTSHPAYMYQCLAGSSATQTVGLCFIPPYSCGLLDTIDNIPAVNAIGSTTYTGGVIVFTQQGATLKINGVVQTGAEPVLSVPWETYKITGLTGNVTITSTGAMAAGIYGLNGVAGFAGYYAGFDSLPKLAVMASSSSICRGDTTTLTGTGGSGYLWSNGATTPSISVSPDSSTQFTVIASHMNGCSDTEVIAVTVHQLPVAAISGNYVPCTLDTITLTASGGSTFAWSNGAGTTSITNLAEGTYMVTVTDANSCSGSASAVVGPPGILPVTITSDKATMCSGDSAQICAPTGYQSYTWNNNATGQCIYAKLAGNYYVTVTNNANCSATSNHLGLAVHTLPPVSISVNGDTLTSYNGVTYQWYLNGSPLGGDTAAVLIATQSGNYQVAITDTSNCGAISNAVVVTISGINKISGEAIRVYPNPLESGAWNVECGGSMVGSRMELFDNNGRLVFKSQIRERRSEIASDLEPGVYVLKIYFAGQMIARKLIRL